jgi:pyruvate dehydrogenase E2 component (dihydrolipoamide acetyltransferase)
MAVSNDNDTWGPIAREPLTRARKAIAEAMVRSVSTTPHATDTDDADVTDLDKFRRGYRSDDKPDRKLSILPFVIRATAMALQKHPIFNASYDAANEQIIYHRYISIAIGVQTDRGLIAPVLRNADQLTIPQIADELAAIAERARTTSFEVNDTRGGTFTISNAGAVGGSRYSIPIINPPQAAILALGRTRWQPWVIEGKVIPRFILPLSISFDHRLTDGADEIRFMQTIIGLLENPVGLVL